MSAHAIVARNLGKSYRIGARVERYRTIRDSLVASAKGLVRTVRSGSAADRPTVWALRHVSFEVTPGSLIGVIGRNGAGKSTLLKLLSRITDPSEGDARIWGRTGSLLEVGTGFHPELTGRENIYLSGTILGMRKREINLKFDDMVAFAEVERFIDTPVKHYSSGMYLRLAFAVAAHLEPDILMVDEVLAVGDARFQRKCMDKMQDVRHRGCTVLFVSHSMPAITRLCERAILLEEGALVRDGRASEVVAHYLHSGLGTTAAREWRDAATAPGGEVVRLRAVRVRSEADEVVDSIDIRQRVGIELEYEVVKPGQVLLPHFDVHNAQGVHAFVGLDQDPAWRGRPRPVGRYVSTGWIPGNLLSEGLMLVSAAMRSLEPDLLHFVERNSVAFQVTDTPGGDTARGDYPGGIPGAVRPLLQWTTRQLNDRSIGATEVRSA